MSYDALRPAAFRLRADVPLVHQTNLLRFPQAWKGPFLELQRQSPSHRGGDHATFKIRSLNKVLRALVPDIISVATYAGLRDQSKPWLFAAAPVAPRALLRIVRAWARVEYADVPPDLLRTTIQALRPDDIAWEAHTIDLGAWKAQPSNGTACWDGPPEIDPFKLLPDLLASRLSAPGVTWEERQRPFRRASSPGGVGAELMTWDPLMYTDRDGNRWLYSVKLNATLQTVPYQGWPQVHLHTGVRRWASLPVERFNFRRRASVYLRTSVGWLEGLQLSESFQTASVERPRGQRANGGPQPIDWDGRVAAILAELQDDLQVPFPDPTVLRDDPTRYLNGGQPVTAALVHASGMLPDHEVGPGIFAGDRAPAFDWAARQLEDLLEPVAKAPRVAVQVTPHRRGTELAIAVSPDPQAVLAELASLTGGGPEQVQDTVEELLFLRGGRPKTSKDETDEQAAARKAKVLRTDDMPVLVQRGAAWRRAIANATSGRLTAEQRYQDEDLRARQERVLRGFLGLFDPPTATPNATTKVWETPELTLTLTWSRLGAIGGPLELDPTIANRDDQAQRALRQRLELIRAGVPRAEGPTITLVELDHQRGFARGTDPKAALRIGLAEQGRLSQFMQPRRRREGDDELGFRALKSWRDLFRQLGAQEAPPAFRLRGVTLPGGPIQYLGVWLLNHRPTWDNPWGRIYTPVAVRMASDTTEILAWTPGLGGWQPYAQALLELARADGRGQGARPLEPREVAALLRDEVIEPWTRQPGVNTLLMVDAQNMRLPWPFFGNGRLQQDALAFLPGETPQPIENWPGLRVLRIRRNADYETPEWYAGEFPDVGLARGVWALSGDRVFGSTADKPRTAARVSPKTSKMVPFTTGRAAHDPEPQHAAFNPQIVEMTVAACQLGDTPAVWAALGHALRTTLVHHDDAVIEPSPLHLCRGMRQYVLPRLADEDDGNEAEELNGAEANGDPEEATDSED